MMILRHESANGRTLVFIIERPSLSTSEYTITNTPFLSLQHIVSRTVSPLMLASMVGTYPPIGPEEALLLGWNVLAALRCSCRVFGHDTKVKS